MKEYDYSVLFANANEIVDKLENSENPSDREKFIELKMSLAQLMDFCAQSPEKPINEIFQKFHDDGLNFLVDSQNKKLKDAETFCQVQKLSEAEAKETMDRVKDQLIKATECFKAYQNFLADILMLKINEDLIIVPVA